MLADQPLDRRRDEALQRLALGRERGRISRDATGLGSTSKNSTRSGRSSTRSTVSSRPRSNPGRVATPSRVSSSTVSGSFHVEEVDELVGADEEDGIVEVLAAEQVDRARIRIEAHLVVGERGARELETDVRRQIDVLVPGTLGDEHGQPRKLEALLRRARERDVTVVRWIERAAEAGLLPFERLLSDLDLVALARAGRLEDRLELGRVSHARP